ncbi:MAG: hypothetical protein KME04_11020 [Pleurocapsa minor GSE-CHR-MK-17-07R]|jgi:hypothetical protein|nr:hypothetical protein [Pleurocapsa minor GSE-CHR-MK 17-07R]
MHEPDDLLATLRGRLLRNAQLLADGLDDAIEEASLRERAAALGVVIDRLIRLSDWRPHDSSEETQAVRIEYQYPDGTIHDAPPWSAEDHGVEGAFSGRRLRTPLRQNRAGEMDEP